MLGNTPALWETMLAAMKLGCPVIRATTLRASERLALTASGHVRYALKTPYRDGTTHIVLDPLDLMARLLG